MKVEIRSKVVILLCIVLAVFSSCITDDDDDRGDFALVAGDALPQFSVEMSDGGVLNTQSFSGKVGVIVFFHTDCPDCQKELPVIQNENLSVRLYGLMCCRLSQSVLLPATRHGNLGEVDFSYISRYGGLGRIETRLGQLLQQFILGLYIILFDYRQNHRLSLLFHITFPQACF